MGQRAIYKFVEDGEVTGAYSHWGANCLTPFYRLGQAMNIQHEATDMTTTMTLLGLNYDGKYNPEAPHTERVFDPYTADQLKFAEDDFANRGYLEMRITLDLDNAVAVVEYNKNYFNSGDIRDFSISFADAFEVLNEVLDTEATDKYPHFWAVAKDYEEKLLQSGKVQFLDEKQAITAEHEPKLSM